MNYLLTLLLILAPWFLSAQHEVVGKIFNTEGEALPGATVVLLTYEDSLMTAFNLSHEDGRFRLDDIAPAEYILQVSYIGHQNYSAPLLTDWSRSTISVAPIYLDVSSEILQEITVKAEHIPMGIRGDTISYNADAFKTRPNATVEDLLKQLPGIEVERNGNIKAQGEDVENVLVDGKEFFGKDPTMATKNLQAEAVDKVEVYDKPSEIAEFTGIDDGEDEKTINLKLKEDHKQGGFGNARLGLGTEETYFSKLNYFRFSPSMQASLILAGNNINEPTFSIEDRIDFMGGIANAMSGGGLNFSQYEGLEDGLNTSWSAGLNFNYDFSSKVSMRSHYLYNRINNDLYRQRATYSITEDFRYDNLDSLISDKTNSNHQINTKLNIKVNPLTEFAIRNNFNFADNLIDRQSVNDYYKEGEALGNSASDFNSIGDGWAYDMNALFKRKFIKKGRSAISSITYKRDVDMKNEMVVNRNRITGNFMDLDQNQMYDNLRHQFDGEINFTEPISSHYFLGLHYNYGRSKETPNRRYFDIVNNTDVLNELLSAEYSKIYTFHRGGLSLRRNVKKLKMKWALEGQLTDLAGLINNGEQSIRGDYRHLLPSYTMEYEMKGGKSIDLNYFTSVVAPQLDQLMPLPDNTNANFQYIGNPGLVPQYDHRLGLGFHYFDNFSFTSLFANLNATLSNDRIVYRTLIDDNLFQIVEPVNTDKYRDIAGFFSFSRPFKPLKLKYRLRSRMRLANYDSFINELSSNVVDNNMRFNFSLSNRKTEKILVEAGLALEFSSRKYGIDPGFNQKYNSKEYYLTTEFYSSKGWTIASDINYTNYASGSFEDAPSYFLWTASISKLLFKDKLEVRLAAYDILNQNIGYRRGGDSQSVQETNFRTLGQFFMLSANYRIGKGKDERGGMVIEID